MEIIVLVIFETDDPPPNVYYIPTRRLYCLERADDVLVWTLMNGSKVTSYEGLPILYRPHSCIGADLIYDQAEFELACKKLANVEVIQKLSGTKIEVTP